MYNKIFQILHTELNNGNTNKLDIFNKIIKIDGSKLEIILLLRNKFSYIFDLIFFKENQELVLDKLSGEEIIKYIQVCKDNEGFLQKWTFDDFAKYLLKNNELIDDDEISITMIGIIIKELCEMQNITDITQIQSAGSGEYCSVLKIGQYILKYGKLRNNITIPSHKRILKPFIRQMSSSPLAKGANIFLEIQHEVDTKWYESLTENEIKEELYKIFKELREDGIVWSDIRKENVGRLILPNNGTVLTYNTKLKTHDELIGFECRKTNESAEVLDKGELVILDTDYICYENEEPESGCAENYYEEFERRWSYETWINELY